MSTISTSGINPQQIIRSEHLLRIINALNGTNPLDIIITGSLTAINSNLTGSLLGTASYAVSASWAPGGLGEVTSIIAGNNIVISPTNGKGNVTITSTGGSGGGNSSTSSYGSFYSTSTQTNDSASNIISFNNTYISNGVLVLDSTKLKVDTIGEYNIQFSAQIDRSIGDTATDANIWLSKNGTPIPYTNNDVFIPGIAGTKTVAAWNWFVTATPEDYYEIQWGSSDINTRIVAATSGSYGPAIPSSIATVNRIDIATSNTGSFTGSFIGSLFGTASYATTSSYAMNGGGGAAFPYTGSARITGSLGVTGSLTVSGSVGIGTNSPTAGLTIARTTGNDGFAGDAVGMLQVYANGTTTNGASITAKNYYGTSQLFQYYTDGTRIGSRITTNTGKGNVYITYGNNLDGIFITGSNGSVGIGTITPLSKLHIADGTGGEQISITRGTGKVRIVQDYNLDNITFYNNDASKSTISLIGATGYVGIGKTTPNAQLDVKGDTIITGSLTVTNEITGLITSASYALSSSYSKNAQTASYVNGTIHTSTNPALSASYALTASYLSGYVSPFPYTGSAKITGSLGLTGSLSTTGAVTFSSLAGSGTRAVLVDENGNLNATTAPSNIISLRSAVFTQGSGLTVVANSGAKTSGDFMMILTSVSYNTDTALSTTNISGWNTYFNSDFGGQFLSNESAAVYYKTSNGTETDVTITNTGSITTASNPIAVWYSFKNTSGIRAINYVYSTGGGSGATPSFTVPSVAGGIGDLEVVGVMMGANSIQTVDITLDATSIANGWVLQGSYKSNQYYSTAIALATRAISTTTSAAPSCTFVRTGMSSFHRGVAVRLSPL